MKLLYKGGINMNKKLLIGAGIVAVAVIGYLIYMYVLMPASQM
jgi:preprotein translocase subunit Sss1